MLAISAPAVGIYCRISRDREGAGLGVARQEEDCRALADRLGWTVVEVYADNDISASQRRKPRKAYQRMLDDVRSGRINGLLAWHPDRLHRRNAELEGFIDVIQAAGTAISTVKAGEYDLSTATGRMQARIVGAVAQHESELKAERIQRKHEQMAHNGEDGGSGRPFGYEDDRKTVRPDEAQMIREAARRVLAGESVRAVVRDWNAAGVPTVTGGHRWSVQVVRRLLASARISGRRSLRGTIVADAEWPAIISHEDSDSLRRLLLDPKRRRTPLGPPRRYLMTGGLARCGLCGAALVARPKGDGRRSYVCASGPSFHGCGKIRILTDPADQEVVQMVLRHVAQGDLAHALAQQAAEIDHEAADEYDLVTAKLARVREMYLADEIDDSEYGELRKGLVPRLEAAKRRLDASAKVTAPGLRDLPDPLDAAWPGLSVEVQRAVLDVLLEAVVIHPAVKGRKAFDPNRVEVAWRPL